MAASLLPLDCGLRPCPCRLPSYPQAEPADVAAFLLPLDCGLRSCRLPGLYTLALAAVAVVGLLTAWTLLRIQPLLDCQMAALRRTRARPPVPGTAVLCLLYTSDAADE